jgi:methyl-accepting chemotaxis protein
MATNTPDVPAGGTPVADLKRKVDRFVRYVPRGDSLPEEAWAARHRNVLVLLVAHVPFLFLLGRFTGVEPYVTGATFTAEPLPIVLAEVGVITGFAVLARWSRLGRRVRTALAAAGLMTCSAVLAHLSGGFIEAHFHFFVMIGVVAAYEDWLPFVVGILFVAVEHSVFGIVDPGSVYNHPDAIARPWGWALVHATFLLGLAAALVSNWFSIERSREETRAQIRNVQDSEEAKAEVERLNERLLVQAEALAGAMDAVSRGDFTADPPRDTEIEAIDEISDAFRSMTRELSATIVDLRQFAASVEETTQSVYDDAETLERTQTELAGDVREFAADLRDQASALESTTDGLSSLSATIEEIAANADQVSDEASTAADAAGTGTDTAAEAVAAIEHIEHSVEELADLVDSLDERMDEVAESTGLIEGIAKQTNTLALNANIEAARADTGSQGFAVVADEVKSLADETRNHSGAIGRTIDETIADVTRVKEEMAQTRSQIQTGSETTTEAGDAFTDLSEAVRSVDDSINEVAAATDDSARTTEEVVDAIIRVADGSRSVAEQSESLADRAEGRANTISEIRAELKGLTDQTGDLQRRLDTFDCETGHGV